MRIGAASPRTTATDLSCGFAGGGCQLGTIFDTSCVKHGGFSIRSHIFIRRSGGDCSTCFHYSLPRCILYGLSISRAFCGGMGLALNISGVFGCIPGALNSNVAVFGIPTAPKAHK